MTNELVVNPLQNERFYNLILIEIVKHLVVNPLQNERFYNMFEATP